MLPKIKFKHSCENQNLKCELDSFPILKGFSGETDTGITEYNFLISTIKSANI